MIFRLFVLILSKKSFLIAGAIHVLPLFLSAGITQLVECHPSKVKVASSSLVSRSNFLLKFFYNKVNKIDELKFFVKPT